MLSSDPCQFLYLPNLTVLSGFKFKHRFVFIRSFFGLVSITTCVGLVMAFHWCILCPYLYNGLLWVVVSYVVLSLSYALNSELHSFSFYISLKLHISQPRNLKAIGFTTNLFLVLQFVQCHRRCRNLLSAVAEKCRRTLILGGEPSRLSNFMMSYLRHLTFVGYISTIIGLSS